MTVQPHITGTVGAPRAVYLRFPAGNQVGEAGKPHQQRAILKWVLEAAANIKSPGTILELPYRWRRFPIEEQPVFSGESHGARHPQAEAIGEALDTLVRLAGEYRSYLESRATADASTVSSPPGLANSLAAQIARVEQLIELLDTQALDQLREIINPIATLELRASGRFV